MDVYVINHLGKREHLSPALFPMRNISGLHPAAATITTEKMARHGTEYNSSTTDERNIVFSGFIQGNVEKNRSRLYAMLPPGLPCTLEFHTDTGVYYINGEVETNEVDWFQPVSTTNISVICPDPFFRSEDREVSGTAFSINSDFPHPNDYILTVEFQGGASEFVVTNNKEEMTITHGFKSGDILVIDTKERTIAVNGVNRYNSKSGNWVLLNPGKNEITTSYTSVIKYTDKYIGI